jgi:carboxylesterase
LARVAPRRIARLVLLSPTLRRDGWATSLTVRVASHWPTWWPTRATVADARPRTLVEARRRDVLGVTYHRGAFTDAGVQALPVAALAEAGALARRVSADLNTITTPTLIVHARRDDVASLANVARLQEGLAGSVETIILDDGRRRLTVDRHRDVIGAGIVAFATAGHDVS